MRDDEVLESLGISGGLAALGTIPVSGDSAMFLGFWTGTVGDTI